MKCPRCQSESVVKRGKNHSGSQRYLCKACNRHFTPQPNPIGYPPRIPRQAVEMYLDGHSFRRIGHNLRVKCAIGGQLGQVHR
ncbi:MAG: IS1 family transposase [Anaerolineae bacterium]|nr:IS1 family transposase [Anaerolineae bacterium]